MNPLSQREAHLSHGSVWSQVSHLEPWFPHLKNQELSALTCRGKNRPGLW